MASLAPFSINFVSCLLLYFLSFVFVLTCPFMALGGVAVVIY